MDWNYHKSINSSLPCFVEMSDYERNISDRYVKLFDAAASIAPLTVAAVSVPINIFAIVSP